MIRKGLESLEKSAFSTNTTDMVSQDQKLQAMLEYCLLHCSKDNNVPKTNLFKLIYLADFAFYYQHGKSISEHIYKNRDYGPVPDTLFALVDEMTENGDIKITQSEKAKLHELAVKPMYANKLTKEEIEILSRVCKEWKDRSSREIVDFVHSQRPWALTKKDEPVPY